MCHQSKVSCRPTPFFFLALRGTTVSESTAAGARLVHWCAGVVMTVCHVVTCWMCLVFVLEAHCLEGRKVHRVAGSRYEAVGEEGNRVGCQGLALGEARCVELCTDSVVMVH